MSANTLLLRLEGPLQSWGDQESKFLIRRTRAAPSKSGVIGLIRCAMGIPRGKARAQLTELNELRLGVRIDRPGTRWWDYHTVGAGMQMQIAEREGKTKPGAMLTRREYLCDASFLVALRGDPALIRRTYDALARPVWPIYLGRRSCPPSVPLLGRNDEPCLGDFSDLETALCSAPWHPRTNSDAAPRTVQCLLEWRSCREGDAAPPDAEIWYDVARSFDVPGHEPRFVVSISLNIDSAGGVLTGPPCQTDAPAPLRPRADYRNTEYRARRRQRLEADHWLCVFCKSPAGTVQHITYRRAGGDESQDDLRSLCRLCHDAVTMIEYGLGMGLDRINPEDRTYREQIIRKRQEIIEFRSLETRRRRLESEDVE